MLRAPAPAIRCFIIIELRLLARPVLGARHSHSPGPPGALCWQQRLRRQGRGTAARSRRPMTAQRRGRWRRRRGPRPAARHSQSGPAPGRTDQSAVAEPQPTAEHRGQGRSWAQLGAEAKGSGAFLPARLRPWPGPRLLPHGNAGRVASHLMLRLLSRAMGEVLRLRTQKWAFLQHARSNAYCEQGTRVRAPGRGQGADVRWTLRTVLPSRGRFTVGQLIEPSLVQRP